MKVCNICKGRVVKAGFIEHLVSFPTVLLHIFLSNKGKRLYKHNRGLFTDCKAILLTEDVILIQSCAVCKYLKDNEIPFYEHEHRGELIV